MAKRDIALLVCGECKERNYSVARNRKGNVQKLAVSKYCPSCGKHTTHKETKA